MEVFKNETREIIRRFLVRRITFPCCIAALDDALADLTPRLTVDQIRPLQGLVLDNSEIVMNEMHRRENA